MRERPNPEASVAPSHTVDHEPRIFGHIGEKGHPVKVSA